MIERSFEYIKIVNELSGFLIQVDNPAGGGVAPVEIKVPVTVAAWSPTHAGRLSVIVSLA
jgi:hypothetical protein